MGKIISYNVDQRMKQYADPDINVFSSAFEGL
jgi:hypothetical protein